MELKILNFNIHKGMAWHSRHPTLPDLRKLIRKTNADLVFLQEVHGENERETEGKEKRGVDCLTVHFHAKKITAGFSKMRI